MILSDFFALRKINENFILLRNFFFRNLFCLKVQEIK